MDKLPLQKILFRTAFCTMACDGHIDEREIEEMRKMDKNAPYFSDVDLSDELEHLIEDLKSKGKHVLDDLFDLLFNTQLNFIEELMVLEVALRIIHADTKVEDNEVRFIRLLRSQLSVANEMIEQRFGKVDLLFDQTYARDAEFSTQKEELMADMKVPEMGEIEAIDLSQLPDQD